ncbi:hypothetical protein DFH06DRAFT_1049642 [Mycena polygramma]|nr:hypothetical protein DFH06DRAFT_1049642 [Mycena polygramma]
MSRTGAPVLPAQMTEIRELLRCHAPPPSHLFPTLSALAEELARYDLEITKVKAVGEKTDHLRVERATVEAHYQDCKGLFAPIRRLPSELLTEIFGICWDSFTSEHADEAESLQIEMARLAHAPLLTLSQVCFRWHSIALGTPALWSHISLAGVFWIRLARVDIIMDLLRCALERSSNHPLVIRVTNEGYVPPHRPAFNLLTQQSLRWRMAAFLCPYSDLQYFSAAKSRLPRLEFLDLQCWDSDLTPELDIFGELPRLQSLVTCGRMEGFTPTPLSFLPWEQLTEIQYDEDLDEEQPAFMALIPRLSKDASFCLRLSLELQVVPAAFSFVASNMSAFAIELSDFSLEPGRQVLDLLFTHLTLPFLTVLQFNVEEGDPASIPWPNPAFLSLAERSSFSTHLLRLYLNNVVIAEAELLQCLTALPALQRLSFSDYPELDDRVETVLVTNTLLAALTRTADSPCLVPGLDFLTCRSMLQFDDEVFLTCLLSRLQLPSGPFGCELWWRLGYKRELEPMVSARLNELRANKEILFSFVSEFED